MSNVNYSFTNQDSDGSVVFRSTVNSFGLDHITDKDLSSFYTNFSSLSYTDTGLLPVDGSGLLSVRSAGNHTQIAYQHRPGMYYINWGEYEGDKNATKYYVAQPYRIVIADLLNGNILGARTFYSPIPITYPEAPLYHVNLPNINCKGYRGNGVGWICLYHTEDISTYPFNEKLAKILDRCSGTEAYNNNNMSETDGPRFYRDNNKLSYLWDPSVWEAYSDAHGYEWTLDPDLWIPVLVQDMDHQDMHHPNGQPLTFVDAILGNYKAYYTDSLIPKPINSIARNDLGISSSDVFNWFKQAYNSSSAYTPTIDPYKKSSEVRVTISSAPPVFSPNNEEDETWICDSCESSSDESPTIVYNEQHVCSDCIEEYYQYCEDISAYVHHDDSIYLDQSGISVHSDFSQILIDFKLCDRCNVGWYKTYPDFNNIKIYTEDDLKHSPIDYTYLCAACYDEISTIAENLDNSDF